MLLILQICTLVVVTFNLILQVYQWRKMAVIRRAQQEILDQLNRMPRPPFASGGLVERTAYPPNFFTGRR